VPIPPSAIFSLIAAGYPADIVIPVTTTALNGVYNRTVVAGKWRPSDPEFYPLVEALQRIQDSRSFSLRIEKRDGQEIAIGTFAADLNLEVQRDVDFVKETLKLAGQNGEVILDYGDVQGSPNELAVKSRSMMEVMVWLSADIEVPAEHVSDGRTLASAELPTNASRFDRPRVAIHSGMTPPGDAFAAVTYRGTWYWISDQDFGSKRSLTFLLLFFSLAETGVVPEAPVLTIPVQ
jgi:hypothetical protein